MHNSHLSFKISLPFHTKATTSDFPRHPLFTPRHFQVETENLSIYLGFPGIRQSRARAASDRLTSLEAQKEHSEQLHVQGIPVQRSAHPSCAGSTAHVLQPCSRPQAGKSELSSLWNVQDKQTLHWCLPQPGHTGLCYLYIHSLCGVKYRSHRYIVRVGER